MGTCRNKGHHQIGQLFSCLRKRSRSRSFLANDVLTQIAPDLALVKIKSKQRNDTPNLSTSSKQISMPPLSPTSNPTRSSTSTAIPSVYSPFPSKKLPRYDRTRVAVVTRDHECVVLDVAEDIC